MKILTLALLTFTGAFAGGQAVPVPTHDPLGIALESYPYPFPVAYLHLTNDGQRVQMAYMDVPPKGASNGRTVFLLHGKNFFGAYWKDTAEALTAKGFRVVVPDQIGFGKSTKADIEYSFDLFAANTIALADSLKVKRLIVVGHSMGGMVAMRLSRSYPDRVERLILEDPIGLEDYGQVVPFLPVEAYVKRELDQTPQGFRDYVSAYYVRKDPNLIEPFVKVRTAVSHSPQFHLWARAAALTTEMILQQPTVYDLPNIKAPSLVIVGEKDRTAVTNARVTPEVRQTLGHYPELGRRAAKSIPNARLVVIPNVGHIPHLEARNAFLRELLGFLTP